MLAHALGNPFRADELRALADRHGLWLVEDCCDAFGSTLHGRSVGTFGHLGTLSFYPAHHITTGEGGAVFTDDPLLARIVESFRDWGRDCYCAPGKDNTCGKRFDWQLGDLPCGYDHKYTYSHAGYNLKITDMQAALGVAQMARLGGSTCASGCATARNSWSCPRQRQAATRPGSASSSPCGKTRPAAASTCCATSTSKRSAHACCSPAT